MALQSALELMEVDGEVCVTRADGSFALYEQMMTTDGTFKYIPLQDGIYRYNESGAQDIATYQEFVADVTDNGVNTAGWAAVVASRASTR
jgi:hypothetical protein